MKFDTQHPWPDGTRITFADGTQATFERMDRSTKTPAIVIKFDAEDSPRAFTLTSWDRMQAATVQEITFPDG